MWKSYFGDKAKIYGIDINPNCKKVEEKNIKIMIGSQSDRDFLRNVVKELPPFDILIDDGGIPCYSRSLLSRNFLGM